MSKGEAHKKHHYVPQTYLRQFAHSKGKSRNSTYFLHACNRQASMPFLKNIKDACQIANLYRISDEYISRNPSANINSLSIEVEHFADCVETNLADILRKINQRKDMCLKECAKIFPMGPKDKFILAKQIIIQFLRHPRMKVFSNSLFDATYPPVLKVFQQLIAREKDNRELADLEIDIKKDETVLHAQSTYLNDKIVESFATDLSKNIWSFIYSPTMKFMTSDNPVVLVQRCLNERPLNLGLNQKGAIKFYAISPDLLLLMMEKTTPSDVDCKFGTATELCISTYHQALCAQSQEIYSFNPFDNNFKI